MARKVTFEKDYIIDKSIDFIKEKGIERLSVRELTKYIGCSTQPIFRLYDNMDVYKKDLQKTLSKNYNSFLEDKIDTNNYFLSTTYAYALYAKKENDLFKALFISDLSDNKILKDKLSVKHNKDIINSIMKEYNISETKAESLYKDVIIYTHGLATQLCLKSINISDKDLLFMINTCIKRNIKGLM